MTINVKCAQNEDQPAVNICLFIHVNILNFQIHQNQD